MLIIHEIFGMTDWVQDLADQVAEAGYIAGSPRPFPGLGPNGGRSLMANGGSLGSGANWYWYSGQCGGQSIGIGYMLFTLPSVTTNYYVRAEGYCNTTLV